ncbi:MAG: tRNA (adenosine(37)-N6)-threonylcarbamoyltransferase complex transferase subunit TsaD [Acetobacter sp.]|nr:tRNA (adenosine(37)-N6)-threonylcarbamoyltransferase complex transferase subunit TsaD [Acetobacter sp.]
MSTTLTNSIPQQPLLTDVFPSTLTGNILAIESSCDETACAILTPNGTVLAQRVVSQEGHAVFGGVVPEIAARAHLSLLPHLVSATLADAQLKTSALALVAASTGPGLIGGLIVGSNFAKGLALALNIPFIAINHIEAHALTARLPHLMPYDVPFPYLLLLVSGGHCQCVAVEDVGSYRKLGGTIDDAVGETFDKVAKMLGLGWPGGPMIEKLAKEGCPHTILLPRPLFQRDGCDFSFSGLKTAIAQKLIPYEQSPLPRQFAADLAASFQQAVADIIADRVMHALDMMPHAKVLVAAGGVAANNLIRTTLKKTAHQRGLRALIPPTHLCTDNAVMVAWAALEIWHKASQHHKTPFTDIAARARPRWPLEEIGEERAQHDRNNTYKLS